MKITRKLLSFLLIGCILFLSCFFGMAASAASSQIGYVNGTNVYIRKDATTASAYLAQVSNVYVTVNGYKKGVMEGDTHTWYNVTYDNITGYIRDDLLVLQTVSTDKTFEEQLKAFPSSYASYLRNLHSMYPNWQFKPTNLSLTFDEAVELESTRKLVQNTSVESVLSMGLGAYDWNDNKYIAYDTNWYIASREVIRYHLDPRNFLNKSDIYMYMHLGYDATAQTEDGLNVIIRKTFLTDSFDENDKEYDGGSYVKLIMKAAKEAKVNPYVLAATIIQEQGTKGASALISGAYPGYEGYYNFFNVQASGSTTEQKIKNGLKYAKSQNWSSIPASIIGGAKFCANNYITQGQDTYFKMNFNLQNPDRIWHEYAGAVHNALSCGRKIAKNYSSLADAHLTFHIPVYKSMPSSVCQAPDETTLRNKRNNYYFNSIVTEGLTPSFSRFTYNYDLHLTGNRAVKVTVPKGASYASGDTFALNTGQNKVTLKVKSETGYTTSYVLNVKADKACTLYVDYGQGGVAVPTVAAQETQSAAKTVKCGDTNGDGKISLIDLANVQRHLLGKVKLKGDNFTGADTNHDNKISLIDLANVQRHLLGKLKLA